MAGKPPLDLSAEVTLADGSKRRWDSGARAPADRPTAIVFRTRRGEGFADASLALSRRVDREYIDLNLLDDFRLLGADGSVAYEGRTGAIPRSLSETSHMTAVQLQGWMSHAKDRKFTQVWVDRVLSGWTQPSASYLATVLAAGRSLGSFSVTPDETGGLPALQLAIQGLIQKSVAAAAYDAGPGNKIAVLYYDFLAGPNVSPADANWDWDAQIAAGDTYAGGTGTGNLRAASGAGYLTGGDGRYALLQLFYALSGAGVSGTSYTLDWRKLAVYGDHGLERHGEDPGGLYVSDMIRYSAGLYAPRLSTAGVQDTTYPVPHAVDSTPTASYDAWIALNRFHLWALGVWERKTLTYAPYDLTDYDWEVRLSDPGVTVDLQGDSVDQLANGICINFIDVATGQPNRLTPLDTTELLDLNPNNPATRHGLKLWMELTLSIPTTAAAAVQIARAKLAEAVTPKGPGTIHITGHVRDRAGHWQPGWKVRADDRIRIADHPNPRPRLIGESEWAHDPKQLTLAVDSTLPRVDAVLDRLATALQAANLI